MNIVAIGLIMLDLFVVRCNVWLQSNFQLITNVLGAMPSLEIQIYPLHGWEGAHWLLSFIGINLQEFLLSALLDELLVPHRKGTNIFDNYGSTKCFSIHVSYMVVKY